MLLLISCASGGGTAQPDVSSAAGEPEERLVYSSNPEDSAFLYSMRSDGSGVHQISADAEIQGAASVSPDGSLIAFEGGGGGTFSGDIYTMRWDGTDIRRLTVSGTVKAHFTGLPPASAWYSCASCEVQRRASTPSYTRCALKERI